MANVGSKNHGNRWSVSLSLDSESLTADEGPKIAQNGESVVWNGQTFQIEKALGQGTSGTCYTIHCSLSQDLRCYKVVEGNGTSQTRAASEPVDREYQGACLCRDHAKDIPNFVTIFAATLDPGQNTTRIIMSYAKGESGTEFCKVSSPGTAKAEPTQAIFLKPSDPDKARIAQAVLEKMSATLTALNARGIYHHDVKLENMIMRENGGAIDVTLIDPGCASQDPRAMNGTARYKPSVTCGGNVDKIALYLNVIRIFGEFPQELIREDAFDKGDVFTMFKQAIDQISSESVQCPIKRTVLIELKQELEKKNEAGYNWVHPMPTIAQLGGDFSIA